MITINCIAIDDEPPALRQIEEYIKQVPYLNLQAVFSNAIDAMNYLKKSRTDLIFLDIQMEVLNGIDFLKVMKSNPKIILTTAYDSYALQAFDFEVDDYLLKPIPFDRFLKSTEKVYKRIVNENLIHEKEISSEKEHQNDYFFIKTDSKSERIDFKDILYIEGLKEYLGIWISEQKRVLTLQNFNNMLNILPADNFIRVHKSYIVALDKINSIQKNRIYIGKKIIPIGLKFKEPFFKILTKRNLLT